MGYRALVRLQLRRAYATLAPRPPAFADTFLYHKDSSCAMWALVQLLHAADKSTRPSHSADVQFLQPSRLLLDPSLTKGVDLVWKLTIHTVSAIADIVST